MPFEKEIDRTSHSEHYRPKVEIKGYNVKIDSESFSDQPINNDNKTYKNSRKIATGQGDDYTTGCLLDYLYFKENNRFKIYSRFKWTASPWCWS